MISNFQENENGKLWSYYQIQYMILNERNDSQRLLSVTLPNISQKKRQDKLGTVKIQKIRKNKRRQIIQSTINDMIIESIMTLRRKMFFF